MRGKTYTQTINFKGTFDATNVLKSLKDIRSSMAKAGADSNLFKNVDKDIASTEKLITEMLAQIQRGFSNPQELNTFQKNFDKLGLSLSKINVGLQDINKAGNFNMNFGEIQKLSNEIDQLAAKQESLKKSAKDSVAAQLSKISTTAKERQAIMDQVEAEGDLEEAVKKVAQAREQAAKARNYKKGLETDTGQAVIAEEASNVNASEFGLSAMSGRSKMGTKDARTRKSGHITGLDEAKAAQVFAESYQKTLEEVLKNGGNAIDAVNLMKKAMNDYGVEISEEDKLLDSFSSSIDNFTNKALSDSQRKGIKTGQSLGSTDARGNFSFSEEGRKLANNESYQAMQENTRRQIELQEQLSNAVQVGEARNAQVVGEHSQALERAANNEKKFGEEAQSAIDATREQSEVMNDINSTFDRMGDAVKTFLSIGSAINMMRSAIRDTFEDIKSLDKSFANIAMVTDYSVQDMWNSYDQYAKMANELGQSTQSVIEASGLYYQQGLDTNESLELTQDTMKLATLAGLDFSEATSQMTAALRGFKMEMDEGERVTDVYAELAAKAAADVEGIATAMSKTASIASSAGMEFETTSAFLTQMIETTQEAPTNIGTAMKTIIARFTELKENVAGTADSEFDDLDYNKVDTALKSVGVSLKDASGQFRDLDDVFLELAGKWDTLDRNSQRYIATIAAGARQQSRFIAMMDNYDRTMELVNVAYDSNGKAAEQFGKYSDTLEYKLNKLTNTWEQMRLKFLSSNFLKDAVDMLNNLLKKFENINMKDILALTGVWLTFGKKAIQNFIKGMQQASASLQTAFEKIMLKASNGISAKLKKIKIFNTDTAETNLAKLTVELNALKNKVIEVDGQQITIGARLEGLSTAQIQNMVKQYQSEFDRVQQNAINLGYNSEQAAQYANNAARYSTGLSQDEYNASLKFLEAQKMQESITKKKQVISASASALGQSFAVAFTSAVTAVVTEADPGQAFGSIFISGLTAMIPQVISVATTMGTMAAVATGGISLVVSLLVGAGTALYAYSKQLKEEAIEASYLASTVGANQKAIEDLTEQHEKLNDVYLETNDRLTELQDNYNNLETAINSYMDLNDQILLSADEQEELLSLKNDIAASAPELVDYYDSEGNAILQNSEYLKEYLELKKEELLLQQQETLKAKNDVNINEFRTAASENEIATEQSNFFNNSEYANQLMNRTWDADLGIGDTISEWISKIDAGDRQAENDAQTLISAIKTYDEAWYNELIEGLKTDENGNVDPVDFLNAYSQSLGDVAGTDQLEPLVQEYGAKLQKIQASVAKETQNTTSQLEEQKKQIDDNFDSLVRLEMETDKDHTITNKNVQELIVSGTKAKMGIEGDLTDKIDADIQKDFGEWFSNGELLPEYIDDYNTEMANRLEEYSNQIASSYEDIVENLEDKDISKLETIYADAEKNGWNAIDILKQISTQFAGNDDILNAATNKYSEQIKQYNEQLIHIADMIGDDEPTTKDSLGILQPDPNTFTGWFSQLSSATQQAINDGVTKASDFGGEDFGQQYAQQYAKDIQNAISSGQIDEEIYSLFNNAISDENFNIFTIEKTKNQFIKDVEELGYGIEEAEYQWENLYAFSQSYGQIEFGITTTGALEELTEQVESNLDSIVSSYENVSNYISTQMTAGGLNLSEFRKLKEELANIGLDVQNFVAGMQNGLYQIDFTALTQAYHDQVDNEQITVEAVKEQINARIAAIDALLAENTSQVNMQNNVVDTTDALWAQAEAMAQVATMAARAAAAQKGQNPNSVTPFTVTKPKNTVKKIQLTPEQKDSLKQERQHLVDLLEDESALAEIAKQQNAVSAAHAQISNDEANAIDKVSNANKGGASAAKDAADAADKLREAQEKLNEALYGTENYKNAADHLANYTERLEELTDKANKAKESLEDLGETDSAKDLLSDYAENVKLENITRTAENQVLQQSMDDLLNILNDKYSEYFQKVGDTWMWNASVVDAQMNDNEKDFLIESIENLNEYQDKIDENLDAIEEREKEFKEMRKTALDSRIALEEEVVSILEEKYQKEIDATQEKYDALKEADDDYLDALEDAINKQRELRDRANEYEDLAQKERKLALKQRDTSGANKKDTLQLQQEVEESRQNMLDNEVDRLLESMKEMYELQQESREAELEYMNAMVENGQLLQEANEIIASFNTREDMLAWFFENNQELADMSVAATEKYKMELEDMYDAAELYYAMSETNLEELTSFTQEEVADTVATIGETLTLEAERSYNEMRETVDKEVEDAKQAVIDAQKAVEDAAASSASAVGGAADYIKTKFDEMMNNQGITTSYSEQQSIASQYGIVNSQAAEAYNKANPNKQVDTDTAIKAGKDSEKKKQEEKKKKAATTISNSLSSLSHNPNVSYTIHTTKKSRNDGGNKTFTVAINGSKYNLPVDRYSAKTITSQLKNIDSSFYTIYLKDDNGSRKISLGDYFNYIFSKIPKNKNGGLVDYTGLAWVDGTTTEPEAFLSADDTKRIGEAAKLLSNLPILNSTSSASTQLSTNIGDTSIEIHINVDSISSDYDVDRLAERIKSDIVDASKPVGTPVILKR